MVDAPIFYSAHLIANQVSITGNLPADITPQVKLRRPSSYELDTIRSSLPSISSHSHPSYYEYDFINHEDGSTSFCHIEDSANWHYYLLSDSTGGDDIQALEPALVLLHPSIDLSIRVLTSSSQPESKGIGPAQPHIIDRYHYRLSRPDRHPFSIDDFIFAADIRKRVAELNDSFGFIRTAVTMMKDVRLVPERSRLHLLGYFAIVENLIAHSPRLAESLDSISHQFQGKLELLTNLMGNRTTLELHFSTTSKVWKKLYAYRSSLAHGNPIDFKKEFSQLGTHENVTSFMALFTKELVLYAIDHSQLFFDLKQC